MKSVRFLKHSMNDKGFLTLDYLFAFILVMSITGILFAFTFTLSIIEVTQYITFSAARNYFVAHEVELDQIQAAEIKFASLVSNPIFAPLINSGWFEISAPEVRQHTEDYEGFFAADHDGSNSFRGVRVNFVSKVLDIKIPLYGSTSNNPDGEGFNTKIGAYLGKEPNLEDCRDLNKLRWEWIKQLDSIYATVPSAKSSYRVIMDNGC